MTNLDLSPLLRGTIGFDRLMNLLDQSSSLENATSGYPPYNIEKLDAATYTITMAVAGFGEDDINITTKENSLVIEGKKQEDGKEQGQENGARYLHRGIATRAFQRSFQLADHIKVVSAEMVNGMLTISLIREIPEAMKPKHIPIKKADGKNKAKKLEDKAA